METPMRRKDRQLPPAEAEAVLRAGAYGTLATAALQGGGAAVPLSYVWLDGCVYFHCARQGQKLLELRAEPRVCFCVVTQADPVYDGGFTVRYQSAVVYGRAAELADNTEKHRALAALCEKYLPGEMDKAEGDIAKGTAHTAVVRIEPERITGKANTKP